MYRCSSSPPTSVLSFPHVPMFNDTPSQKKRKEACLSKKKTVRSKQNRHNWLFFFFYVLGSHLPMSRKLLGEYAALLGSLQSPIKWYNKKKERERKKERNTLAVLRSTRSRTHISPGIAIYNFEKMFKTLPQ